MIVYGTVPSRRLDQSIGINNIPVFIVNLEEQTECRLIDVSFTSWNHFIADDLLSIVSVRPVREDIIGELLGEETILAKLMDQGKLHAFLYEGKNFTERKLVISNRWHIPENY